MRFATPTDPVDNEIALNIKIAKLEEENRRLVEEIRNLRCLMVEAAGSISPVYEPLLFAQLTGEPTNFISADANPYPEHDNHVSDQYMAFLSHEAQKLGQY